MREVRKGRRGNVRSTLALAISIVALIVAVLAWQRTSGRQDLSAQVRALQRKVDRVKEETLSGVQRVQQETARALRKAGIKIRTQSPPADKPAAGGDG